MSAQQLAAPAALLPNGFAERADLDLPAVADDLASLRQAEARFGFSVLHYWNRRWEYPFCLQAGRLWADGPALDAGAGRSLLPLWLAGAGRQVVALDVDDGSYYPRGSLGAWYRERQPAANRPVRFVEGDLRALPFGDGTFGAVFSMSVLEHLPDPLAGLRELWRVVQPQGILAVTVDVSLDGRREVSLPLLERMAAYLEARGTAAFPRRQASDEARLTTDWFRAHEPAALPWPPEPRTPRARLGAALRGRWRSAGKWAPGAFYSLGVAGLAYRKEGGAG